MALNQQAQAALRRLTSDLKEVSESPIANVSAIPLENNMFEWHCNFKGPEGSDWADTPFHVIMSFPQDYPAKSPSVEFLPEFHFSGGATMRGKKGTKICLSIFSDFAFVHTEWADDKGTGWSPSYTTQTVLLNLISFIMESQTGYYGYGGSDMQKNISLAKGFSCTDCGHTPTKPYPPFPDISKQQSTSIDLAFQSLTCYVTKQNVKTSNDIFGFGIAISGNPKNPSVTSPCEFMTYEGYNMLKSTGKIDSVLREEIKYFLPQYISTAHGSKIKKIFEQATVNISGYKDFNPIDIIQVLPKLMNSTVVTFMNGTTHTSERALHGYFSFHRLFLWACNQYPKLQEEVDYTVQDFIQKAEMRSKKKTPNLGEWITLLSVCTKGSWDDAATAYLSECYDRNVMWYLKENPNLIRTNDGQINSQRVKETFRLTKVSRNLSAFQVLFLDIARPKGMSIAEVCERYDTNFGIPTFEMEDSLKKAVKKINTMETYEDLYNIMRIPYPGNDSMNKLLSDSVDRAQKKEGYNSGGGGRGGGQGGYSNNNSRGGYSNNNGGRGGGQGGYGGRGGGGRGRGY